MIEIARVRVKVVGKGTDADPFRVDLPTYQMISGTEKYAGPDKKQLVEVEVWVPDDECDEKGQLSKGKIRVKYKDQPRWDHDNLLSDVT